MAFPVVQQAIESNDPTTAATSHTVTLPTATAGQLLLIISDRGSTIATVNAHSELTELLDENLANGLYISYRWMDGGEPASYTLVTSASTRLVSIAYRISGAENPATQAPQIGTTSSGTSATPDPPASAAPGSTKDYLFIAFYGAAGEEANDDTWSDTPPTNYTPSPPRQISCGVAGTNLGGLLAAAERQLNTGAAQDPGTFAKDVSAAWRAQTILVSPASLTQVPTGNALESDAALALGRVKIRTAGLSAETDASLALGRVKIRATGLATETDASLALGRVKLRAAGLSTETDSGLALGRIKLRGIGASLETDLALALGLGVQIPTGRADETDVALGLAPRKLRAVGVGSESDSGLALGVVKLRAVAASLETDAALAVYVGPAATLVPVGTGAETDGAFALDMNVISREPKLWVAIHFGGHR